MEITILLRDSTSVARMLKGNNGVLWESMNSAYMVT